MESSSKLVHHRGQIIDSKKIKMEPESDGRTNSDCFVMGSDVPKSWEVEEEIRIIFSIVLYGCGTWSLTLREEHRLRVFENRGL